MRATSRKLVALASASVTLALAVTTVLATAPSGETTTRIARGQMLADANVNREVAGGRVRIKTDGPLDALMLEITLAPGGTGGWHSHAGPLITVVKQGALTIVEADCTRHDIGTGQAVISPGSIDKDENTGTTPVTFDVTFLIPDGVTSPRIDQPAPAGCTE